MINANTPFIETLGAELITGMVIRANTNGDTTKQAARAAEVIAIVNGLQQINNGGTVAGLAAIQQAIQGATALDPAEALALQTFIGFAVTKASMLASLATGTILGTLQTAYLNNFASAVVTTAQAYIPAGAAPVA